MKQSNLSSFMSQDLSKDSLNSSSESLEQDDLKFFVVDEQPKKKRRVVKQNRFTKVSKSRKWNDEYVAFGFYLPNYQMMCSNPEGECLICGERLSNSSLAPAKLKRHLANHREYQTKTKEFFERIRQLTCKQKCSINQTMKGINGDTGLLRASYRIADVLCKQKRPFTESEDVIKPSLIIAAEELHGKKAVKRVN